MINTLIETIKEDCRRIKGIKFFRYDGVDYINAQNNNSLWQIWFEDDIKSDYLLTKGIAKITFNIDILNKVHQGDEINDAHNDSYKIASVLLNLLNRHTDILSLYDYSFMTLSHFSDDDLSGGRLTVSLFAPDLITACNIDEYLDDNNQYDVNEDNDIDVTYPQIDINDINITPKKLNKNEKDRCSC